MDNLEYFRKKMSEPLDYSKLPYDCPAAAAKRIRESHYRDGTIDATDLRIVLGDPMRGVSFDSKSLLKLIRS